MNMAKKKMGTLTDKVAIITGAASGIGKATAECFSNEGASVACIDVNRDGASDTADAINKTGGNAIAVTCDISSYEDSEAAVSKTVEAFGSLDVLCNIAGTGRMKFDSDEVPDEWDRVIAVNLTGTFYMSQHALPHLLKSSGTIINCSSIYGTHAVPWATAYAATKGGICAMTRSMAATYIKEGLRVNCVAPGPVFTPIAENFLPPEGADHQLMNFIFPVDKLSTPEGVADAFAFLASDKASNINGVILRVDCGLKA